MASLDYRLKKIDEKRNCFFEKLKHNYLMGEKHEKVCWALNYFEHFLVSLHATRGCVSFSSFASLVGISVGIASSIIRLNICEITAGINRYKPIIKKKRKYKKIVLLRKAKLDTIEVLISKTLIDSYISHDKFALVNNVLREYNETKEEIKNPENIVECII